MMDSSSTSEDRTPSAPSTQDSPKEPLLVDSEAASCRDPPITQNKNEGNGDISNAVPYTDIHVADDHDVTMEIDSDINRPFLYDVHETPPFYLLIPLALQVSFV